MQNIKERQEFENYNKIKLLGEGSFGKAFLVERASDKLKCVMKQIDITKMSEQEKKETVQESKILEALSHPNIVKFIEVFKTKKGKLCIIMDYADGGDLASRAKEQRGRYFTEAQILEWFTQICLGLKHIHDRKILHRDLKGGNIFLTKQGIVKIGDFGIAKVLSTTMQNARTVVGTPYYLSPEIVQSKPYNFKSDIWSLGVVLYEMIANKPPFDAPSLHFLAMKIVRGAYNPLPSGFSSELKALVGQMLNTNEKLRPDVNKILASPIIQNRIKVFLTETIYQKEFSHTILHKQNVFDPKQLQLKQIQNLQQQISQNKAVIPGNVQQQVAVNRPQQQQQQQNVPRYNPVTGMGNGGAGNNKVQQQQQQQQNAIVVNQQAPPQRAQPNKNIVSPGMAAAFGGGRPGAQVQDPSKGPAQYGAYVPTQQQQQQQQKPNYHYQQQQREVGVVDKTQEEMRQHQQKMRDIDMKLKEKEAELKKIDEAKREREAKRQQYEREILERAQKQKEGMKEADKRQKEQEVEMQKRRMQEDQSRKIQEAQQRRREELDKIKREGADKRRQVEEESRKRAEQKEREKKAREDEARMQEQIQKNIQQQQQPQQQQQQQKQDDLSWIKKMTEDAQNKIFDIEKKMLAKEGGGQQQQQQPMNIINFEPPKQQREQPKSASRAPPQQQSKPIVAVQDIKKVIPTSRKESQEQPPVDKKQKEIERRKAMEEAKKNWGGKKQGGGFVQMVGMPEDMGMEQKQPQQKQQHQQNKALQQAGLDIIQSSSNNNNNNNNNNNKRVAQTNYDWKKNKVVDNDLIEQVKQASPQPKKYSQQLLFEQEEEKKQQQQQQYYIAPPQSQQYDDEYQEQEEEQQQQQQIPTEVDEEYREVYQMYEEMLQLIKNDFNQVPEKDESSDNDDEDDDEGFNDERDSEWDKDHPKVAVKQPVAVVVKDTEKKKDIMATKKRFDETLQTIQEESEPENTFANTSQKKGGNSNIQDIEAAQEDRDDIIDEEDTDTSSQSNNNNNNNKNNNRFSDFTFANGNGDDALFTEVSKFTSVEHLRDFLETALGEEKTMKVYPIFKDFGDNIFFEEKQGELQEQLKGVLTGEEIKKYQPFFASLIFMELQAEREGGGEMGIINAMKTLKNINTTATFGKFF